MNGIMTVLCTWAWACAYLFSCSRVTCFSSYGTVFVQYFWVSDTPAAENRSAAKVFRHHHLPPENRIVNEVSSPALLGYDTTVSVT